MGPHPLPGSPIRTVAGAAIFAAEAAGDESPVEARGGAATPFRRGIQQRHTVCRFCLLASSKRLPLAPQAGLRRTLSLSHAHSPSRESARTDDPLLQPEEHVSEQQPPGGAVFKLLGERGAPLWEQLRGLLRAGGGQKASEQAGALRKVRRSEEQGLLAGRFVLSCSWEPAPPQ